MPNSVNYIPTNKDIPSDVTDFVVEVVVVEDGIDMSIVI